MDSRGKVVMESILETNAQVPVALSLCEIPMPSRTTRKSTRPGASDRSMVDTVQPPGLASFRDRSASPRLEDRAPKMGNRLNVIHGAPKNHAHLIVDRSG